MMSANSRDDFSTCLYKKLVTSFHSRNLFFSPLAMKSLLGMLELGANGKTKDQIVAVLTSDVEKNNNITSLGVEDRMNSEKIPGQMSCLYVDENFHVNKLFEEHLKKLYTVDIKPTNFCTKENDKKEKLETTTANINKYFGINTSDCVKYRIQSGVFGNSTSLVLASTLHLELKWKYPFNPVFTAKDKFRFNEDDIRVKKMYISKRFPYGYIPEMDAKSIAIPFEDARYSMIILLPSSMDGLPKVQENIGRFVRHGCSLIGSRLKAFHIIDLKLPKFEIASCLANLHRDLDSMGVNTLFNSSLAELEGMVDDSSRDCSELYVFSLNQRTFIKINEGRSGSVPNVDDTTSVFVSKANMELGDEIIPFNIDRPYFYQIIDHENDDLILFCGHVYFPYLSDNSEIGEFQGVVASSGERAIIYKWRD